MAHGDIAWIECASGDVEATKAHYARLCGWTYEGMPLPRGGGTYWLIHAGEKSLGGIISKDIIPYEVPAHWLVYLEVGDIAAAVATVRADGGKVYRDPFDIPGIGQIAIVAEPSGAGLGLFQPFSAA